MWEMSWENEFKNNTAIEDTKVVNRTRDSKKDGQYNDQKKKDKMVISGTKHWLYM
jgi:hypothetical protein